MHCIERQTKVNRPRFLRVHHRLSRTPANIIEPETAIVVIRIAYGQMIRVHSTITCIWIQRLALGNRMKNQRIDEIIQQTPHQHCAWVIF